MQHQLNKMNFSENIIAKSQTYLVRYVYMHTNIAITVSLFCACITFIGFFSLHGDNSALLIWFTIYLFVTVCRVVIVHIFECQPNPEKNIYRWYLLYIFSTMFAGMIWGLPSFLLLHHANEIQQMLLLLILGGVTVGVVPVLSPLPVAAIIFLIISLTPYIFSFSFFKKDIYILFVAALILYLSYSIYLVLKCHAFIKSSMNLKFDNEQLQHKLNSANKQLAISDKKLKKATTHDGLTRLATWDLFKSKMCEAITQAKTSQGFFALLYIDLDHFKYINAKHGHNNGDRLLLTVVARLKQLFGCEEIIARLGSDEFVVILENMIDVDAVKSLAQQLCQLLANPYYLSNEIVAITASVGISIFPDDGDDIGILLATACNRMVYAKDNGGNHYQLETLTHGQS